MLPWFRRVAWRSARRSELGSRRSCALPFGVVPGSRRTSDVPPRRGTPVRTSPCTSLWPAGRGFAIQDASGMPTDVVLRSRDVPLRRCATRQHHATAIRTTRDVPLRRCATRQHHATAGRTTRDVPLRRCATRQHHATARRMTRDVPLRRCTARQHHATAGRMTRDVPLRRCDVVQHRAAVDQHGGAQAGWAFQEEGKTEQ